MNEILKTTLSINAIEKKIMAKVDFLNKGNKDFYLWNIFAPKDNYVTYALFKVFCNEKEVNYIGILAKRDLPEPDEFIKIKPGEMLSFELDLMTFYAFPKGLNNCEASFYVYNPSVDHTDYPAIRSNFVKFEFINE